MNRAYLVCLALTGCATPQEDPGLQDIAIKTPEQAAAEREQDIESARQAGEWQEHVCSQTGEERKRLIEETAEKHGWRIICPG